MQPNPAHTETFSPQTQLARLIEPLCTLQFLVSLEDGCCLLFLINFNIKTKLFWLFTFFLNIFPCLSRLPLSGHCDPKPSFTFAFWHSLCHTLLTSNTDLLTLDTVYVKVITLLHRSNKTRAAQNFFPQSYTRWSKAVLLTHSSCPSALSILLKCLFIIE